LCELAGVQLPEHLQGTSFVPLLDAPGRPWKEAVFARYHAGDSVRTDRYLYTEWKKDGERVAAMLYDHKTDPDENVNISEEPESAEIIKRMQGLLKAGWEPVAERVKK
jgi:arylsulfatase A-like enzyme